MSLPEWSLIVGVLTTVVASLGPWMFKVHAKLEVIASKMVDVCEQIERASQDQRRLWELISQHASRLDTHDVQLSHIAERMRHH